MTDKETKQNVGPKHRLPSFFAAQASDFTEAFPAFRYYHHRQLIRKSGSVAIKRLRAAGAEIIGATMSKFSVNKLDYTDAYRHMNYSHYCYGTENKCCQNEETQTDKPTRRIHQIGKRMRTTHSRIANRFNLLG